MIEDLQRVVQDAASLNSKLVLLIGGRRSGKSALLHELSSRMRTRVFNVGFELGRELLSLPKLRRNIQVSEVFKALADASSADGVLLADNLELLFDRTLRVTALDLLRSQARVRPVVAVWPGDLRDHRLCYAVPGHPEYQDYSPDGVVLFRVN